MTAQPRRHRDREPGPAASPRRASSPPPEDNIAAGTPSRAGRDSHGRRLAYFVDEAARVTGRSRDLLYDQKRRGNLAYVKVGMRCLITRQHLQQFLGIAS
jgi:excisionase family DNA binding protein